MKRKRGDKEEKERNYTKIEEEKKKKLDQKTYRYIGETSRSAYEREHLADLKDLNPGSNLLKHVIKHHIINPGQVEFRMKILTTHFTAFDRQITEAVNAGSFLLNSKAEYNRSSLPCIKTNDKKSEWKQSELDDDQIAEGIKFLRK